MTVKLGCSSLFLKKYNIFILRSKSISQNSNKLENTSCVMRCVQKIGEIIVMYAQSFGEKIVRDVNWILLLNLLYL